MKTLKKFIYTGVLTLFVLPFMLFAGAPEVKMAKVGDVELAYYIRGEGKPLLMINGYKCTMSTWDPALIEDLEKSHQLILFDNRGAGLSTDTVEDHTTIAQMADDAAGIIKALGFKKAHILGWSMGARIAQQLVIRNPDVVDKVLLCAANPGGSHQVATSAEAAAKLKAPVHSELEAVEQFYDPTPEGIQQAKAYLERLHKAITDKTIPNDLIVKPETVERQDRARGKPWNDSDENFDALSKITASVLISDGRNDVVDLPGNVRVIANQIPFSWTAYFDGGHAYLFQNHAQFADLVKVFLND
jgi:pimeloyl-ACP methyl ester carboxylesterase